jgi:hypothetical protein
MTFAGAATWTKSLRCTSATCVEVWRDNYGTRIRDSKQNTWGVSQPIIALTTDGWRDFTERTLAGEIDQLSAVEILRNENGDTTVSDGEVKLNFDANEWSAFVGGLADGDFD